jgi:hypothetical protein
MLTKQQLEQTLKVINIFLANDTPQGFYPLVASVMDTIKQAIDDYDKQGANND